jgi:sugar O-acyltransferase (sialic acid O-acetyltransferase NeuD family)
VSAPPLVIIGAGDHGLVVLDLARALDRRFLGFIDPRPGRPAGQSIGPGILLGDLSTPGWLESAKDAEFVVAVGDNDVRAEAYQRALALGMRPASLIHPSATVLGGAVIGAGAQVCAGAIIGTGASILEDSIVNTAATIDHHDRIGPHAFVGPGATLAGRVVVEERAWVGIGATIREGSIIGRGSYVAAGAVVIADVGAGSRVAGVPAVPMSDS